MQSLKLCALVLCMASALCAQSSEGIAINQTEGSPPKPTLTLFDYAGGANVVYIGVALQVQNFSTISCSTVSNANPAAFTCTAHGFDFPTLATISPEICVAGGTGGWAGINGCWVATITSANALTIPVDSTGFGAFGSQVLTVTTDAPLDTAPVWSILKNFYDGSGKATGHGWAALPGGAGSIKLTGSSTAMQFIWANRATLAYQ